MPGVQDLGLPSSEPSLDLLPNASPLQEKSKAGDKGIPMDPTDWATKFIKEKGSGDGAFLPAGIDGCLGAQKISSEIRERSFIYQFILIVFKAFTCQGWEIFLYNISL